MIENIIKLCAIFDPVFIVIVGCAIVIFLLLKMFRSLNEGNSDTKRLPLNDYTKTKATIVNYETANETVIVEKDGRKEQVIMQRKYPIVEYYMDDEVQTYKYPKSFYKEAPDNIGYEFDIYIKSKNDRPIIKYDDIYYKESRIAEKTTYIVSGIVIIIFAVATIFSIIGH